MCLTLCSVWADHADAIAKAYAGSGALKSDFTRTNVRSHQGVLEDGYKSVMRYLKNTFFDGAKQVRNFDELFPWTMAETVIRMGLI